MKRSASRDLVSLLEVEANKYHLSAREKEVLAHYLLGKSISETADALGVSKSTVQGYGRRLEQKLGVRGKRDLVDAVLPGLLFQSQDRIHASRNSDS